MTVDRSNDYCLGVLQELRKLPAETEWFECKHNNENIAGFLLNWKAEKSFNTAVLNIIFA